MIGESIIFVKEELSSHSIITTVITSLIITVFLVYSIRRETEFLVSCVHDVLLSQEYKYTGAVRSFHRRAFPSLVDETTHNIQMTITH
jgi:hypothetical protein